MYMNPPARFLCFKELFAHRSMEGEPSDLESAYTGPTGLDGIAPGVRGIKSFKLPCPIAYSTHPPYFSAQCVELVPYISLDISDRE